MLLAFVLAMTSAATPGPFALLVADGLDELPARCKSGDVTSCRSLESEIRVRKDRERERREALANSARECDTGVSQGCVTAALVSAASPIDDHEAAIRFAGRACRANPPDGCAEVLGSFRALDGAKRALFVEEARAALAALNGLCTPRAIVDCRPLPEEGPRQSECIRRSRACGDGADAIATGVPGLTPADRGRALVLLRSACEAFYWPEGYACQRVAWATAPDPTPTQLDDLAEWIVRQRAGSSPGRGDRVDHRALCVAFRSAAPSEGDDPPTSFMARLSDLHWVHPVSWCRDRRQGSILALGPVPGSTSWPPGPGVVMSRIDYSWDGRVGGGGARYAPDGRGWKYLQGGFQVPVGVPEAPRAPDPARDPNLIAAFDGFVNAWNRGDPGLPGVSGQEGDPSYREHTRLVVDRAGLSVAQESFISAHVTGEIVGTFEPAPGRRWPAEPWKQKGARAPISITISRTGGWWREGRWETIYIAAPWYAPRPVP